MTPETNIQQRKLELIQWLTLVDDDSVLEKVARVKDEDEDWWDEISGAARESIQKGKEDAENGNLRPHSDARAIYEKWL